MQKTPLSYRLHFMATSKDKDGQPLKNVFKFLLTKGFRRFLDTNRETLSKSHAENLPDGIFEDVYALLAREHPEMPHFYFYGAVKKDSEFIYNLVIPPPTEKEKKIPKGYLQEEVNFVGYFLHFLNLAAIDYGQSDAAKLIYPSQPYIINVIRRGDFAHFFVDVDNVYSSHLNTLIAGLQSNANDIEKFVANAIKAILKPLDNKQVKISKSVSVSLANDHMQIGLFHNRCCMYIDPEGKTSEGKTIRLTDLVSPMDIAAFLAALGTMFLYTKD